MLDAAQARIVAYMDTEAGEFICARHADDLYGARVNAYIEEHKEKSGNGWDTPTFEAFDSQGLQAYSRYHIHTMNAENAHVEELPVELGDDDLKDEIITQVIIAWDNWESIPPATFDIQLTELVSDLLDERCSVDGEVI